jgi:uncharacterized coiled-coil protein SlyX
MSDAHSTSTAEQRLEAARLEADAKLLVDNFLKARNAAADAKPNPFRPQTPPNASERP